MSRHTGQTQSKPDTKSEQLQLAVLTQQNNQLIHEILPFRIAQYQHQDELNLILITAKQFKHHYFTIEQQPLFSLLDRASQVSGIAFLVYLIDIYGAQLTKGSVFYLWSPN